MMYRLAIVFILITMSAHHTHAQVELGAKAGINLTSWSSRESNTQTAFHAGILGDFNLNEDWSASVEVLYSGKGTDLSDYIPNNPMSFTLKYLSMPVMIGYNVKQVTFKAGLEVSSLLSSLIEINNMETNLPEAFEDWDYGILAGATLQIFKGLHLEVRYVYGLKDVVEIYFVDVNGQALGVLNEGKNRALQLGLRYEFEL